MRCVNVCVNGDMKQIKGGERSAGQSRGKTERRRPGGPVITTYIRQAEPRVCVFVCVCVCKRGCGMKEGLEGKLLSSTHLSTFCSLLCPPNRKRKGAHTDTQNCTNPEICKHFEEQIQTSFHKKLQVTTITKVWYKT